MFELFKRVPKPAPFDGAGLGTAIVARQIGGGCALPAGTTGVAVDRAGRTRRIACSGRVALLDGESGWCFHPGPYGCDLVPFAASPEIGLRTGFVIDSPDPRVTQQRFDLFLASEAEGELTLAGLVAAIEAALQRELAQESAAAAMHDARGMERVPGRFQPAALHPLRADGRRLRAGGPGGPGRVCADAACPDGRSHGGRGGAAPLTRPPPRASRRARGPYPTRRTRMRVPCAACSSSCPACCAACAWRRCPRARRCSASSRRC
ncbi:hypothetical protein [Massilia sp. Dwa41.01b]|uniref:hypothetical protein n=1 Tax=Massilia sp. Dwa41.01b TaxID=2709302 RepID=UPI001E5883D2|nr:hypothetical protein [Massilia sp. Dwa41.01b]